MSHSILVVEFESHVRRLIQVNLERAGYHVFCAANGVEARLCMEIVKPRLVIVDTMLPDVEIIAFLGELKAMTACTLHYCLLGPKKMADPDAWLRIREASKILGPTSWLTKPFNPMELLSFVKVVLCDNKNDGFPIWHD